MRAHNCWACRCVSVCPQMCPPTHSIVRFRLDSHPPFATATVDSSRRHSYVIHTIFNFAIQLFIRFDCWRAHVRARKYTRRTESTVYRFVLQIIFKLIKYVIIITYISHSTVYGNRIEKKKTRQQDPIINTCAAVVAAVAAAGNEHKHNIPFHFTIFPIEYFHKQSLCPVRPPSEW